jgi:hypothetical protein
MSGSVFLSGGWSIGSGISSAVVNKSGRRASGAVSRRQLYTAINDAGSIFPDLLALVGIRTRFRQVDYRSFRELLNLAISGRVRSWGRDTYLYDSGNRLVAIKRAAKFDANGRCTPSSYFVRRLA